MLLQICVPCLSREKHQVLITTHDRLKARGDRIFLPSPQQV